MRQQDRNHDRSAEAEDNIWTVLPVALIVVLSVGILTMGVLKSFTFGPSVGDVIVFRPTPNTATNETLAHNDITAIMVNGAERRSCVLSPTTMGAEGGSLLVERSFSSGRPVFQAHWAGHHTSESSTDCGQSADLLIQPNDLLDLAGAAGGFGFTHKLAIVSPASAQAPTLLD
jgi:hypothetical protein